VDANANANAATSDSKIRAISSILNLCKRATINMEREGISNAIKAIIIICMKYVDKEALFKAVLPNMYIDWEYVRAQGGGGGGGGGSLHAASAHCQQSSQSLATATTAGSSHAPASIGGGERSTARLPLHNNNSNNKRNLLGDGQTWLHVMQFLDFGEPKILDRTLQRQYPPLYCMHSAILASGTNGRLNFNDACKILILNIIEGLTSKMMIELHTTVRLNCSTLAISSGTPC
jgi:hypothetical protein